MPAPTKHDLSNEGNPGKNSYSIVPSSGALGASWPSYHTIPQGKHGSLSTGGWTEGNEGFTQQTFLGASIRSFNINAGFGDTSSSLSVQLVNDEFFMSDLTSAGMGDDPYHSGAWGGEYVDAHGRTIPLGGDTFRPPVVGTPVYFKFGKNPANIEQAYRKTFDDLYKIDTIGPNPYPEFPEVDFDPDETPLEYLEPFHYVDLQNKKKIDKTRLWKPEGSYEENLRGKNHFVFGGILQSYTQNRGGGGNPLYSVSVSDPREILSNVVLLFNNYQGTTFNSKNILNLYGFLEYDPSNKLKNLLDKKAKGKGIVKKFVNPINGVVSYAGYPDPDLDLPATVTIPLAVHTPPGDSTPVQTLAYDVNLLDQYYFGQQEFASEVFPTYLPVTGQGFSRRGEKGIPFYRVSQAIAALFQRYGFLPKEYREAGFGGVVNFRGYNYIVDFGGIPLDKIPLSYYIDFDQIDILGFAQELCDIISHELYVTLLPVIDHPSCKFLYDWNDHMAKIDDKGSIIAGIIRLDAIDKTRQPKYGAIKSYLDNLEARGVDVENQDVGFELSNVTTDKFVVGAQEIDMHYFTNNRDRDDLQQRRNERGLSHHVDVLRKDQWSLETSLKQQILPFYGLLGKKAISIPRGFGPYQQIILDSNGLDAFGVGNYYITTEMELRAALVSYKRWSQFLLSYSETYIADVSQYNATYSSLAGSESDAGQQITKVLTDWRSAIGLEEGDPLASGAINDEETKWAICVPRCVFDSDKPYMGKDNYPASPCSPPYGYPLYYKRAQKIGIPEAGVAQIQNSVQKVISNFNSLQDATGPDGKHATITKEDLRARIELYEKRLEIMKQNWANAHSDDGSGVTITRPYRQLRKAIEEAKKFHSEYNKRAEELKVTNRHMLAATANFLGVQDGHGKPMDTPITRLIANLPRTAKFHLENAQKVYNFVKKVAEENLGKKFLVKIPRTCNLRYQPKIVYYSDNTHNIAAGPFGFAPRPVNADTGYMASSGFLKTMEEKSELIFETEAYEHYLTYKIHDSSGVLIPPALSSFNEFAGWQIGGGQAGEVRDKGAYAYGALNCNFNPFEEKWNFNYKPEPQGGFFSHGLYGNLLSRAEGNSIPFDMLPLGVQQGLIPVDMTNLLENSNRIKCYARYDNSEILDFAGVGPKSITQQSLDVAGKAFVPDVMQTLPNMRSDKKVAFETAMARHTDNKLFERQPKSMAFVKCSVDEEFYMPPKIEVKLKDVWAREYEMHLSEPPFDIVESVDDDGCPIFAFQVRRITPIFSVGPSGGRDGTKKHHVDFVRYYDETLKSNMVNTQIENLDSNHVYALVTVPGRIKSTLDQRWASGPMKAYNTVQIENILTADVVKHPDFDKPVFPELKPKVLICTTKEDQWGENGFPFKFLAVAAGFFRGLIDAHEDGGKWWPGKAEDYIDFTFDELNEAQIAQKAALKGLSLSDPEGGLSYIQPSPVYPSMIAIPLMSWERCYGPWLSASQLDSSADARIKYSDIGGKVEFQKDEKLAPWNFAGYQMMNEAGKMHAVFSNSLLLFSERGGFVFPDAPTGIALATALQAEGPIITSIGVDVSAGGVKTTVKLDLYTAQYGKLQKQKEGAISQIARERQKIIDQNNNATRRGFGKQLGNRDLFGDLMDAGGGSIIAAGQAGEDYFSEVEKFGQPGQMMVLDDVGGAIHSHESLKQFMGNLTDVGMLGMEFANKVFADAAGLWMAATNQPNHSTLPNPGPNATNPTALDMMQNPPGFHND